MTVSKKLGILALSLLPLVLAGIALWALLDGNDFLFFVFISASGFVDSGLAVFYIPHVHNNPRLKDGKLLWIVLLGLPYITVAPLYWLIYVLPEKPGPPEESAHSPGGAWYADPWGEAPFRWWDGERWTDWVTGPPTGTT